MTPLTSSSFNNNTAHWLVMQVYNSTKIFMTRLIYFFSCCGISLLSGFSPNLIPALYYCYKKQSYWLPPSFNQTMCDDHLVKLSFCYLKMTYMPSFMLMCVNMGHVWHLSPVIYLYLIL